MANESDEVRAYGDGSVYVAPVGTAFPADIDAVVPAGWTQLGFVTEDGVVPEFGQDTTDVGAWQSADPVRILLTKKPKKIDFSLLQVNAETMELALGGGTWTEPSAGVFQFEPADESFLDERALLLEAFDGDVSYRIGYRKALKDGAVQFPLARTKASEFKISMRILAADGGLKPYVIQTNDPAIQVGS